MDFGHFSVSWVVTNSYNTIVNPTYFYQSVSLVLEPSYCNPLIKFSASLNYTKSFTSLAFGFPESFIACVYKYLSIDKTCVTPWHSFWDLAWHGYLDNMDDMVSILSRFHCIIYLAYSSWVSFSVQIIKASTSSLLKASSQSSVGKSSSTFRLGSLK